MELEKVWTHLIRVSMKKYRGVVQKWVDWDPLLQFQTYCPDNINKQI